MGSKQSRRHSLSCDWNPSSPHNTTPRHRCSVVNVSGLPRRFPELTNARLMWVTQLIRCCSLGMGSCFALWSALSWVIIRNSFRSCNDLVKGFSFCFAFLAIPFLHLVGVNGAVEWMGGVPLWSPGVGGDGPCIDEPTS